MATWRERLAALGGRGPSRTTGPSPEGDGAPPQGEIPLLDLLRERRRSLGAESMLAALELRQRRLLQGTLVGAVLIGAALLTAGGVMLRHRWVLARINDLRGVEAEVTSLQAEMAARKAVVDRLTASNANLTRALTTLRTSSALLTELQLRTPEGVQLVSAQVAGPTLELKGQASDPSAFARINAMQLELRRSPLLDPPGLSLLKVERLPPAPPPTSNGKTTVAPPSPVAFAITGLFATLTPTQQLTLMRQLGSEGMARRLQLLESEGLIP